MFAQGLESGNVDLVECQAGDVPSCIDTETINTHPDECAVAVNQVLGNSGILGIQIHTVSSNLSPPPRVVVPVELPEVVPIVVCVVVLVVGVFHLFQAVVILLARGQASVVCGQYTANGIGRIGEHALVDFELVSVPVAGKQFAQVFLAKVARVVQNHIQHDLHPSGVSLVNQRLESGISALITMVNA